MDPIVIRVPATLSTYDEAGYLAANPDVRAAVASGELPSGRAHFDHTGLREGRHQRRGGPHLALARQLKMMRLRPFLRTDMAHAWVDGKVNFLTEELRTDNRIVDTDNVSANNYDSVVRDLIDTHRDGLVLDCGAGQRDVYYRNVVNFEIVNYDSTDVIGVGERLPFRDDTFDAVISVAVLEHVRDPFRCAREISRVLKPGGQLFCSVPFLQPLHGYPHHYFNASPQGIRRLFEDELTVEDVTVFPSMHPVWALTWILDSWAQGLSGSTLERFNAMTVADLRQLPQDLVKDPIASELSMEKQLELACATVLTARKA
ncbi:methyltransferase domain-containing protein [Xanthobacter sp. DSM 24535]|uniref:class I SAM-dependent methyltransferase n=1 Tax=Roseixanthobacter psychrophilus TaxID=3119917 RepID=UPI003728F6CB